MWTSLGVNLEFPALLEGGETMLDLAHAGASQISNCLDSRIRTATIIMGVICDGEEHK